MTASNIATINAVALNREDEHLSGDELRQRACTELLRQRAQHLGLLDAADSPHGDGVISEAAADAIEALLEREVQVPEPDELACRRHHAAHERAYRAGERVHARHILLAVTPGVDVAALHKRAEGIFLEVRCHDGAVDPFAEAARKWSNCPSGADGGDLGWLQEQDCVPELGRELFGRNTVGVLPHLVHSRFGLHIVEVLARQEGVAQSFDAVRGAVIMSLRQQVFITALRQYLLVLAGGAQIAGVDLDAADTLLVQ